MSAPRPDPARELEALRALVARGKERLRAMRVRLLRHELQDARLSERERVLTAREAEMARGARARAEERTADAVVLARARAETEDLRRALGAAGDALREARAAHSAEVSALGRERDALLGQLRSVHSSRWWRWANAYWSALRALGILRRAPDAAAAPSAPAPPTAPPPAPLGGAPVASETVQIVPTPAEPVSPEPVPVPAGGAEHDVICFPIIEWGFRFQRPQQLMTQFADHGHRVFYLSQAFRQAGPPYILRAIRRNVWEVSLRGPACNVYRDALTSAQSDEVFAALDALRRDHGLGATVSVVELPFWTPVVEQTRARLAWPVVYDCMDYHAGFSTNDDAMLAREEALLAGADLVVVSSRFLENEAAKHARRVVRVPNACDFGHFASVPDRTPHEQPVIGYYGAIADWFDADLVADMAERRPEWRFLLVGSTFSADLSRLGALSNVEMPGEVPYADVPGWIARMDILLVPFRRTPLTEATNPVKAYEILAAGRPLVSVPLPEVVALGDLVRTAETAEEMEREVHEALRTDGPEARARRRAFAREQTWAHRFEALAPEVRAVFPRASVVVVTYNNRDWNERCLASLRERSEWPNLEVIVVDNASKDGTPDLLRRQAELDPRIRLVLNAGNRGFAAANNQGLALAAGEILVLLNNDTVGTRGFLASFARHLLDPGIGLLGPSTNEIANEARVEVGYGSLDELPAWAERFVREHDGALEDLAMLAMFCMAMTRETWERIGPLDERFAVGMFEDDDYAKRAHELGLRTVCTRDAFVHHAGRASFKSIGDARYFEIFEANRARYQEKWGLWLPHVTRQARSMIEPFRRELAWRMEQAGADPARVAVFLPAVGWNISLVQRPHHMARALARRGWFVIVDCTNSAAEDFGGFQEVEPRLLLFRGPIEILTALPEAPVLWTLPYNASLVDRFPERRVVYDCIDDLAVFPYNQALLRRAHERMLREAETVLCVSRPLLEEVRPRRPDAMYVPNAVDTAHFASAGEPPEALRPALEAGHPVCGYYGAIASWLDVEMVAEAARLRPDWSFVLLGQILADAPPLDPLRSLPNVFLVGAQRYERIPSVLAAFDVAFIPFVVNDVTHSTSPLKLFEYFAGGKPVISSPMPECAAFPEVRIARTGTELAAALDGALHDGGDAAFAGALREIARRNSWEDRVGTVTTSLARAAHSPVSQ